MADPQLGPLPLARSREDRGEWAIHTLGLGKRYGDTVALDQLNLNVNTGEVYGYLGPNGAGKTTTIRLLLGLHRPSSGRAELFGLDAWSELVEAHRLVAYVALLFLGIAALAYAIVPRASAGIAYGLVTITFLWQLTGSVLGAPKGLVDLTPFAHVGLVPAQSFRAGAAVAMLAIAAATGLAAGWAFTRRDLTGQ
jgi:hypothetical protein